MKILWLLVISFTFISCGIELQEPQADTGGQINAIREFEESDTYTDAEVAISKTVCDALIEKEIYLNRAVVNRGTQLTYDLNITDCGASSPQTVSFSASVSSSTTSIMLNTNNNDAMKEIITKDSKVISDICSGITSTSKRYMGGSSIKSWYYLVDSKNSKCKGNDNYCLFIETGYSNDGVKFRILDIEAYNFAMSGTPIKGIAMARAFQTAQRCQSPQSYLKEQVFTGTAN